MTLQVLLLLGAGAVTAECFGVWAGPGDERAHFSYVETLAEQRRLPLVDRDLVSPAVEAVTDGTYPLRSPIDPAKNGLRGRSYEAFQPPLYYLAALPVYTLSHDALRQVHALRWLDLALLLCAVAACAVLARQVLGAAWPVGLAFALVVLMRPGVIVRGVSVSNAALELPLALWTLTCLWWADASGRLHALLAAGALVGACLLTKETTVAPGVALAAVAIRRWRGRPGRRSFLEGLVALAIPLVLIGPWLAFNLRHFGAPTADAVARRVQRPAINPGGRRYFLADAAANEVRLLGGLLPEEWQAQQDRPGPVTVTLAIDGAVLGGAGLALLRPRRLARQSREALLLALPAVLTAVLLGSATVASDFDVLQARYLYPAWPGLALLAARGWAGDRHLGRAVTLAAGLSVGLVITWAWLAGTFYL